MDFRREIEIRVSDRASRVLDRINRVTERVQRTVQRSARSSRLAERATEVWGRAVARLGRVYDRLRRQVRRFSDFAVRASRRVVAALAAAGVGIVGGTFTIAGGVRREANAAEVSGLDVNTFRLLREFISRAGGLDRDGAAQLIEDIIEKQQGAREEADRAEAEGRARSEATGTEIDILRSLGIAGSVDASPAQFIDQFIAAFGNEANALFIGKELGEEGRVLGRIASRSVAERAAIEADIIDSLRDLTKEDVENARDLGTAMANLRTTIRSLLEQVLLRLTPQITSTIESIQGAISEFIDSGGADRIVDAMNAMGRAISFVATAFVDAAEILRLVFEGIASTIENTRRRLNEFLDFFRTTREGPRDEFVDEAARDRAVGRGLEVPAQTDLRGPARAIDPARAEFIRGLQERNAALQATRDANNQTALSSERLASAMESAAARINSANVTAAPSRIPLDGGAEPAVPF